LLDEISLTVSEYGPIWLELEPDVECALALNVTQSWVKLQVLLEAAREEQLDFHGLCRPVMQNNLLAIELIVDEHIQIVLLLSHIDGYIYAFTKDLNWDGLAVVLVVEEEHKILRDRAKFIGHKGESYLNRTVPIDVISPFELNLG